MSERDDNRVEYRLSTTGRLVNATQERIDDLRRLRDDREKLSRPKPAVGFGSVLDKEQGRADGGGQSEEREKERPKPQLKRDTRGSQAFGAATVRPSPTRSAPPPAMKPTDRPGSQARFIAAQGGFVKPAALRQEPTPTTSEPWPRRELTQTNTRVVHQGPPPKATPRPGAKGRTIIKG